MYSTDKPQPVDKAGRLWSIDALRGFDMFWIVGGEEVIRSLAKWADWPFRKVIDEQLEHAEWAGFHFEDLIFPLFLFLVGVVLPFSLGKLTTPGESRWPAYKRILTRTILLFVLGLLYYGEEGLLDLNPGAQRYMGVLQRIAICYGIAAVLTLNTRAFGQVVALVAILAGYWALLTFVPLPAPGPDDETEKRVQERQIPLKGDRGAKEAGGLEGSQLPRAYSEYENLSAYVDRHALPGRTWIRDAGEHNLYDNEGLLSTLPAVGTTLLGVLAGHWLRSRYRPLAKTVGLLVAGAACLAAGLAWGGELPGTQSQWTFPVIKNLWTSSYVLVAGGWSLLLMALFYGVIDGLGWRSWSFFFVVIGANAITIYFARHVVDLRYTANYFFGRILEHAAAEPKLGPYFQEFGMALAILMIEWLLLYVLYRHRVFLRV